MSSSKRASLSSNSPLDQLFRPAEEREVAVEEAPAQEEPTPEVAPAPREATKPSTARTTSVPLIEEESSPATREDERELRQTTIMIYADQADWLDEACYLARRENGSIISKAAILRTLVDMAREDEAIRNVLRERLGIGQ
jgi:hypothetical protein